MPAVLVIPAIVAPSTLQVHRGASVAHIVLRRSRHLTVGTLTQWGSECVW